jgi:hypothetical protein
MPKSLLFFILMALVAFPGYADEASTRKVFNKLIIVIGNSSVPKPTLSVRNNDLLVAKTFSSGEVLIGEQFIRNCSRFGSDSINAVACVLSHELVHYYMKHFWAQKFGSAYVDSEWGQKISADEESKKFLELYETQADQLGFYYAFSAGYKTWKLAEPLLDSVYGWYKLKENLEGYPSLAQRKVLAQTSASRFAELIPVFEMSNCLKVISATCLGDRQNALLDYSSFGYEHLMSSNIQTAEMFNNIAVAKILKAQKYSSSIYAGLQLPVVLDQSSMMYEASGTRGDDEQEKFLALMNEALESLDKALRLDEQYWPASVNKSLVLLGLEKYGTCEDELDSKAVKAASKNNKWIASVISEIRGILYYSKGDSVKSREMFASAVKLGSKSARLNEQIMMDMIPESGNQKNSVILSDSVEKWNGQKVYAGLKAYTIKSERVISYANTKAYMLLDSGAGYKIFEVRKNVGFFPVNYVKIAMNYDQGATTSLGLKVGSSNADLLARYKNTDLKAYGTLYTYWIYPLQNIVVMVDNTNNKVHGWFYYMYE